MGGRQELTPLRSGLAGGFDCNDGDATDWVDLDNNGVCDSVQGIAVRAALSFHQPPCCRPWVVPLIESLSRQCTGRVAPHVVPM